MFGVISARPGDTVLPVGMRRSYGDSVMNSLGGIIEMTGIDRFMALDLTAGTLQAEAGVTLSEIMRRVVPFGFFVPVSPGTRFITLDAPIAGRSDHAAVIATRYDRAGGGWAPSWGQRWKNIEGYVGGWLS